jgi:death-on-curing protein
LLLELEPHVEAEYHRYLELLEPLERLPRPCLSVDDVLRAHFLIANHFSQEGEGIGGIGPRSTELLQSAIYRQVVSFGGISKWDRLFDISATLFFGLIKDHAFHDANKRTAFLSLLYQLYENDFCPSVHEEKFEDMTVLVAENQLEKYARFRDLKAKGVHDPEVRFLSKWLKDNTRRIDNKKRSVTFRDLEAILQNFGFFLENPDDNHIEVVQYKQRRRLFGLAKPTKERVRLGRIGFPGRSAQVKPATLKHVREMTNLSAKHGVDSAAFFDGLDPMQTLIASYNEPLMRLAYR